MEFKEKIKNACRVRNVIIICLILLLFWWGSNAVIRFWSQPLSTDISYKLGETKVEVQFPFITLCNYRHFFEKTIFNECHDGSYDFIRTILSCIKSNKTFKEDNLMQNLHLEIRSMVEMVRFWTGSKYVNHLEETGWKKVFLYYFGPCYMFDLSKVEKFQSISFETGKRPGIEFVMADKNPWQESSLILHTRFDLPDAFQLNRVLPLSFSNKTKRGNRVSLRKKVNKRESTRKAPCVQYEYNTCQSIEDNLLVFERFHCSIPILYNGQHLDDVIPKEASNCSVKVMLEALDLISKKKSNCILSQTCDNTRFTANAEVVETWFENKTLMYISFENPEVEYHHSYISYDLFNFIGEIGGILGLTLGASVLSLFDSLFKPFPYY